jgi:hypothetical protein
LFTNYFLWNYRQIGNWDAAIKEVEGNLKYLVVGIQDTPTAWDLNHELSRHCGIPEHYRNLEALFLSSASSDRFRDPGILDLYIREYEWASGCMTWGTIRNVRHVPRQYPFLPYIFFVNRDHFEE